MADASTLTELQIDILSVLWERDRATSTEVRAALEPERTLALTTVTTLLGRLERKGVVAHDREGRRYIYRATITRDEVRDTHVDGLTRSLFDNDPVLLVEHLFEHDRIDGDGAERVRSYLEEAEARHARA